MRIGVHAVAVGVLRIVVQVLRVARDHRFEEFLDVGQQRRLKFVDEERARRVHRPDADEALAHVAAANEVHDAVREVDHLDALVGLHDERFTVNRQAAGLRGRHRLDGVLAGRDGRTLTHALPLACE